MNLAFDVFPAANPKTGTRKVRLTSGPSGQLLDGSFFRVEWNGTGSGQIVLSAGQSEIAQLAKDDWVKVLDLDLGGSGEALGGFFLGPGQFVTLSAEEGGGRIFKIGGPGTLSYLFRAEWWKQSYAAGGSPAFVPRSDGYWHWFDDQYGDILRRGIDEAQDASRPFHAIPALTKDFTPSLDSAGASWTSFVGNYQIRVGYNLGQTLIDFIRLGLFVDMDPAFLMHLYQNDPGRDKHSATFASGKVRFQAGVNIDADLTRQVQPDLAAATALVLGQSTVPADAVEVDAGSYNVVREVSVEYGQTNDSGALTKAGQAYLAALAAQSDTATFPHPPAGYAGMAAHTAFSPGRPGGAGDYWVGDTVTLHTGTGQWDYNEQSIRVAAINWELDPDNGQWWPRPELGSTYGGFPTGDTVPGATTLPTSPSCVCPQPGIECIGGSEVVTGYEHFTWEAGQEFAVHGYPSGHPQILTQDTYFAGGAAGTSFGGDFGSGGAPSAQMVAVPGTTYRFTGYSEGYGQSWPCTGFGIVNFSWGVQWFNSSNVLLRTDVIGSHTTDQDSGYVGPDTLDVVAPATAAYFRLIQSASSLPCQPNRTHIDEVTISTVTAAVADPFCPLHGVTYGASFVPGPPGYYIPVGSQIEAPLASEVPFDYVGSGIPGDPTNVQVALEDLQAELSGVVPSALEVKETDGAPDVTSVSTIRVPQDSLTDDGSGQVTLGLATAKGGGHELRQDHGSMGATETIDPANGNLHAGVLNATCAITVSAFSAGGIRIALEQDGTGGWGVTWLGVVFAGDDQPDPTAGNVTFFVIESDGGVLYGFKAGGAGFDAINPTNSGVGDAAAAGSADVAARRDHLHGREGFGTPVSVGTANAAGSAATVSRSDHVHAGARSADDHLHIVGERFVSDGVTTTYTLAQEAVPYSIAAYLAGLRKNPTLGGMNDQITLPTAGTAGDEILVDYIPLVA